MMYVVVVESSGKLYGPFVTAAGAARWALKRLVSTCSWHIKPVRE